MHQNQPLENYHVQPNKVLIFGRVPLFLFLKQSSYFSQLWPRGYSLDSFPSVPHTLILIKVNFVFEYNVQCRDNNNYNSRTESCNSVAKRYLSTKSEITDLITLILDFEKKYINKIDEINEPTKRKSLKILIRRPIIKERQRKVMFHIFIYLSCNY